MYLIRLDDASEYMDVNKWNQMEELLDKYKIRPIVGVIPNNKDKSLVEKYNKDELFWEKVKKWQKKDYEIALHGCTHVYETKDSGINPVNNRSEFAGLELDLQRKKIKKGIEIFNKNKINPKIFFAPSHTFDLNTLKALELESNINIISDTVANDIYLQNNFYFIPQQSGHVQKLPFKVVTFCYHPNTMNENSFKQLEEFLKKYNNKFISFKELELKNRNFSFYDKLLKSMYFGIRTIRSKIRGN